LPLGEPPKNVSNVEIYPVEYNGKPWYEDDDVDERDFYYSCEPYKTVWTPAHNGINIATAIAARPFKNIGTATPQTPLPDDALATSIVDELLNVFDQEMYIDVADYLRHRRQAGHQDVDNAMHIADYLTYDEPHNEAC
jgi:hypothetical protein